MRSNTQLRAATMMIDVIEANRSKAHKPHLIPQIDAYMRQAQADVERMLSRAGERLSSETIKQVWDEQRQARRTAIANKKRAQAERECHRLELQQIERGGRKVIDLGKLGQLHG